jgi:hypothetical protein
MTTQPPTFETFAIVELFGHSRIAGRVTEQVIAGQGFVRVDVPELPALGYCKSQASFTRMFGPGAIYSITPVDEQTACAAAQSMRVEPVNVYLNLALPRRTSEDDIETDWNKTDFSDESDNYEDEEEKPV